MRVSTGTPRQRLSRRAMDRTRSARSQAFAAAQRVIAAAAHGMRLQGLTPSLETLSLEELKALTGCGGGAASGLNPKP